MPGIAQLTMSSSSPFGPVKIQWNQGNTKANSTRAVNVYRDADPRTRFMFAVIDISKVLSECQIEMNSTSIGGKSTKLVPLNTLVSACDKFMDDLAEYEKRMSYFPTSCFISYLSLCSNSSKGTTRKRRREQRERMEAIFKVYCR